MTKYLRKISKEKSGFGFFSRYLGWIHKGFKNYKRNVCFLSVTEASLQMYLQMVLQSIKLIQCQLISFEFYFEQVILVSQNLCTSWKTLSALLPPTLHALGKLTKNGTQSPVLHVWQPMQPAFLRWPVHSSAYQCAHLLTIHGHSPSSWLTYHPLRSIKPFILSPNCNFLSPGLWDYRTNRGGMPNLCFQFGWI